jgi:hypothetical protein
MSSTQSRSLGELMVFRESSAGTMTVFARSSWFRRMPDKVATRARNTSDTPEPT